MKFKRPSWIIIILYVAIFIVAALVAQKMFFDKSLARSLHTAEVGQFSGPEDAEKVIVEFIDYRCSHCRDFHPTLMELLENNPDTKIVYRHYPAFGKVSLYEAEIAISAAIHGYFDEFHEFLITHEDPVTEAEVRAFSEKVGMDFDILNRDRYHEIVGPLLMKNVKSAQVLEINYFPTLIIDDEVVFLDGLPSVSELQKMLDEAYSEE